MKEKSLTQNNLTTSGSEQKRNKINSKVKNTNLYLINNLIVKISI